MIVVLSFGCTVLLCPGRCCLGVMIGEMISLLGGGVCVLLMGCLICYLCFLGQLHHLERGVIELQVRVDSMRGGSNGG